MSRTMKSFLVPVRRVFNRSAQRFQRSRPGNVLILVVALLVLLALIGTAFMSSARSDRYASRQNTVNTEVVLLVDGVVQAAQTPVLDKIRGKSVATAFRQAVTGTSTTANLAGLYIPWESPVDTTYLASRTPLLLPNNGVATPVWPYISAPVIGTVFEGFYAIQGSGGQTLPPATVPQIVARVLYTGRQNMTPTSIPVQRTDGSWVNYPAFTFTDNAKIAGYTPTNKVVAVIAADADGDGIADSGFIRLPVGQIEGNTFFAAARIIDNAAAINLSIANQASAVVNGVVPGDFTPASIDLANVLASLPAPADTTTQLNVWRTNNGGAFHFPALGRPGPRTFRVQSDDTQ